MEFRQSPLESMDVTSTYWQSKRVFLTGHTGFKGSWLAFWLRQLGAHVTGYALPVPTQPNHFDILHHDIVSMISDLRQRDKVEEAVKIARPEIIFHLAAQPFVRYSYQHPAETFETNVIGTVNLLEACRKIDSVHAIVIITTDKCYENKEWVWGYRENDALGGFDPYSASKGCAELVVASYRQAFFPIEKYGKSHHTLIATCRAGNVIGGGDWGMDRLLPDLVKAAAKRDIAQVRNPDAIRPWQHVLEPLHGYLLVGQQLLAGNAEYAEAWNFGPSDDDAISVREIVEHAQHLWPAVRYEIAAQPAEQLHEAHVLKLDCSKARTKLGWKPRWNIQTALTRTLTWYREFYESSMVRTQDDLNAYSAAI